MSSGKFVRSSKFRHVFGTPAKKDKCYDNLRIAKGPHESDMSSVNSKFLAVVTEVQGGGSFLVLPLEKVRGQKPFWTFFTALFSGWQDRHQLPESNRPQKPCA